MARPTHSGQLAALAGVLMALQIAAPLPAIAQETASPVVSLLFEQARMWRERNRLDLAEQSLRKVIESDPENLEALFQLGLLDLQRQDLERVRTTIARLQRLNPADPRVEELKRAMVTGQPDEPSLAEARRLVAAGQFDRAITAYRRAFRGGPPPHELAPEYYETLAGTGTGWEEARLGLKSLAERSYASPRVRFIYARVLTYNDSARREGIAKLSALLGDPAFGQSAVEAMRQAMLWLTITPADRQFFESYVQRFPADTAIKDKLAELSRPVVQDPLGRALGEAYRLSDAKQLEEAARAFDAILKTSASNADALAGLGIVRLQQERFEEARDLLNRAIAAAPDRQRDWLQALETANFWATYREALAARDRGDFAQAEKIARPLVAHAGSSAPTVNAFLGEVLRRLGRARDAEDAFRAALRGDADNKEALLGLYQVLSAQGRNTDNEPMLAGLDAATRTRLRGEGTRQSGDRLRAAAKAAERSNPSQAEALYQQAMQAEPANPWIRYDFASYLSRSGQDARAFTLIDDLAASQRTESIFAAAVFYADRQRQSDAIALLDRIPPGQRTARMNALRNDLSATGQTDALVAAARNGDTAARQAIIARANAPQATPAQSASAALALAQIGERAQAMAIVRRLMNRTDLTTGVMQQLAYAATAAGGDAEANALVARLGNKVGGTEMAGMKEAMAIRQADRLREQKNTAAAFDVLAPFVSRPSPSVGARMALARVYQDAKYTTEAMQVLDGVVGSASASPDVLQEAISIAINLRQYDRAQIWLGSAQQAQPDNPRLYLIQARLLRAKGDVNGARRALETAQELNLRGRRGDVGHQPPIPRGKPSVPYAESRQPNARDAAARTTRNRAIADLKASAEAESPVELAAWTPGSTTAELDDQETDSPASGKTTYVAQIPYDPQRQVLPTTSDVPLRRPGGGTSAYMPTPVEPPATTSPLPGGGGPLGREIQEEYEDLRREFSKSIEGGVEFRGRSGETGMGRLSDLSVPAQARLPIGRGAVIVSMTPVSLDAGSPGTDSGTLTRFGANQLLPPAAMRDPGAQRDVGVAVSLGAEWGPARGDIGTTPIGFRRTSVVGALSWTQPLGDKMQLKIEGSRRPVTDSLLSYAGTRDPATGQVWGGVTRMGGEATLSFDDGDFGWYSKLGYWLYDGKNVESNASRELTMGVYFRPYKDTTSELRVGVSGTYLSFDKNLGNFTLGHGGYFSPQTFYGLSFPVDWVDKSDKLTYFVGGTFGIQNIQKDQIGYFPGHPDLQSSADVIAAGDSTRPSLYPGSTLTTLGFSLRAGFEYAVSDRLTVGGRVNFESSKEYDQGTAKLYLRHAFN